MSEETQQRIEVYPDRVDDWRWRKYAGSRIVADSGEGYDERNDAFEAARKYGANGDPDMPIEEGKR